VAVSDGELGITVMVGVVIGTIVAGPHAVKIRIRR